MVLSVHTSPHVLTVMEADLSRVLAHQAASREQFAAQGIRLTLTAYFISAIATALRSHPLVNSSWTDDGILLHHQINIGMAVSLGDAGLIVPVIRNADSLSLVGLARTINDLSDRARNKRLTPDEVKGGTFTLTNHGTGGSLFALPIINQPQVGILGTGSLQKRPVVITDPDGRDSIAIRPWSTSRSCSTTASSTALPPTLPRRREEGVGAGTRIESSERESRLEFRQEPIRSRAMQNA